MRKAIANRAKSLRGSAIDAPHDRSTPGYNVRFCMFDRGSFNSRRADGSAFFVTSASPSRLRGARVSRAYAACNSEIAEIVRGLVSGDEFSKPRMKADLNVCGHSLTPVRRRVGMREEVEMARYKGRRE